MSQEVYRKKHTRLLNASKKLVKNTPPLVGLLLFLFNSLANNIVILAKYYRQPYPNQWMPHIPSIFASYMSHTFKDMGHIWDVYGTYMGHPILHHSFSLSET
jgi:hypothetical protein